MVLFSNKNKKKLTKNIFHTLTHHIANFIYKTEYPQNKSFFSKQITRINT